MNEVRKNIVKQIPTQLDWLDQSIWNAAQTCRAFYVVVGGSTRQEFQGRPVSELTADSAVFCGEPPIDAWIRLTIIAWVFLRLFREINRLELVKKSASKKNSLVIRRVSSQVDNFRLVQWRDHFWTDEHWFQTYEWMFDAELVLGHYPVRGELNVHATFRHVRRLNHFEMSEFHGFWKLIDCLDMS